MCLATEDSYFILKVDTGAIATALETKAGLGEDGLEEAFDVSRSFLSTKSVSFGANLMFHHLFTYIGSRRSI